MATVWGNRAYGTPGYNALRAVAVEADSGDAGRDVADQFFAVAHILHHATGETPEDWQYRHGPYCVVQYAEELMLSLLIEQRVSEADLLAWGAVIARASAIMKASGWDS
jgi:hypothetical protein